jgi:diguanylate cyclase (GGDEF)-like protein/PAS domain S-box-containing protein
LFTKGPAISETPDFRKLPDLAAFPLMIFDHQGKILFAGKAFCERAGCAREELEGRTLAFFGAAALAAARAACQDQGAPVDSFLDLLPPGGIPLRLVCRRLDGVPVCIAMPDVVPGGGSPGTAEAWLEQQPLAARVRLLSTAIDQSRHGVLITDRDGIIIFANRFFLGQYGYAEEEVLGKHTRILKSGRQSPEFYQELWETIRAGREWRGEFHNVTKSGRLFWERAVITPICNTAGEVEHFLSIKEDVTVLHEQQERLIESERRYRLISENMSDLICLHDPDGTYRYVSPSVKTLLGYEPEELTGRSPYDFSHAEDVALIREGFHQAALQAGHSGIVHCRSRHKDGQYVWFETLTTSIADDTGRIVHLQTASRDITRRKVMEEELTVHATTDILSGAYNRRTGLEILARQMRLAHRQGGRLTVCFADINGLKTVNDGYGHQEGDFLILAVADALREALRESDTLCRLGGDEFLLILPGCDLGQAEQVWSRVEERLARLNAQSGKPYRFASSRGFAGYDGVEPIGVDELVARADLEMYADKARYKRALADGTLS